MVADLLERLGFRVHAWVSGDTWGDTTVGIVSSPEGGGDGGQRDRLFPNEPLRYVYLDGADNG